MKDFTNYRAVKVIDSIDNNIVYRIIMLNYKHKISEFLKVINKIKAKYANADLFIEDILQDKLLDKFEWFELYFDDEIIEI